MCDPVATTVGLVKGARSVADQPGVKSAFEQVRDSAIGAPAASPDPEKIQAAAEEKQKNALIKTQQEATTKANQQAVLAARRRRAAAGLLTASPQDSTLGT